MTQDNRKEAVGHAAIKSCHSVMGKERNLWSMQLLRRATECKKEKQRPKQEDIK